MRPWRSACLEEESFVRGGLTALTGGVLAVEPSVPLAGTIDDLTQAMDCDSPYSLWN